MAEYFDSGRVADTEAENEPAWEISCERLRRSTQLGGRPCPDANDAGRFSAHCLGSRL